MLRAEGGCIRKGVLGRKGEGKEDFDHVARLDEKFLSYMRGERGCTSISVSRQSSRVAI